MSPAARRRTSSVARTQVDAAAAAWRKVMAIDGESPELWLRLVRSVRESPAKYKALTDELIARLPHTDTAAQAYELWAESLPVTPRIAAFERLIADYPPQTFASTATGAMWLFALYDDAAPVKAAALAHAMATALPKDKEWQSKVAYSDTLAAAEAKAEAERLHAHEVQFFFKEPARVIFAKTRRLHERRCLIGITIGRECRRGFWKHK